MKNIILVVIAALVLSLAGCTGNTDSIKESAHKTDSSQSENQESSAVIGCLGQVSEKLGNDITLSLGSFNLEKDGEEKVTMKADKNGNLVPVDGESVNESGGETIVFQMPNDAAAESGDNAAGGGKIENIPIEFTGEVKDFTIPAGAKITNSTGKEITLDNIKKGSLVQLIVNKNNGIVEAVMVW